MSVVKSITSPMKFLLQRDLLADLGALIEPYGPKAHLICDPFIAQLVKDKTAASFQQHQIAAEVTEFGGECSDDEIERHQEAIAQGGGQYVVGVGGGKTLDTAKAVAHYAQLPVVIIPTLASTDAPCTALSVIYNTDGSFNATCSCRRTPMPSSPT